MTEFLAVYGTLAPGRENHWVLASLSGSWSAGTVRGRRVDGGWGSAYGYPGLLLDPAGDEIPVQVFESASLAAHWSALDAFEGAEYERVLAEVRTHDRRVLAHVYVLRDQS
jgi:gamma-glutamylcyclotransferase (GGCT)/AIG2-like uncharacterized protein YtfP